MRPRVTKGGAIFAAVVTVGWVSLAGPASALLAGAPPAQAAPPATVGSLATGTAVVAADAAPPTLGGWNISADGNVVDILVDNTTGLAGVHPLSEADFPEAESTFATGPFGSALATVFWPGSAGGNFGSLSSQLGFPSQLAPLTSQTNDPIKAASSYPAGPPSARYPAGSSGGVAVMQSSANAGGTAAEGTITDEAPSSVLSFSSAKGSSSSQASNKATAHSDTDLSDVKLLGGLIGIGSITSTAQAASDGNTGTGSATTNVTGVTFLGKATTIGSTGIVIPNFPSALQSITGPIVQNAISQVVSGLGLTVTEFPATQAAKGTGYTATSGGVSIQIDPPSSAAPTLEQAASVLAPLFPAQAAIIPTLPGLLQGLKVTITLGRATASANASPGFNAAPFTPPANTADSSGVIPQVSVPPDTSTNSSGASAVPTGSSSVPSGVSASTPGSATGSGAGSSGDTSAPPATLIRLSSPLGAGAVVVGIFATLLMGAGLMRVARMLLPKDVEPVCPLGQD